MARRAEVAHAPRRPSLDGIPECTACGACCFSELPEYVRVFGIDWDRMDEAARAFTEFRENRCYMRMDGGRCTALVLDPGLRRFTCSIYEARPDVCRSLERGTGQCAADRHAKTDRTLVALAALVRR